MSNKELYNILLDRTISYLIEEKEIMVNSLEDMVINDLSFKDLTPKEVEQINRTRRSIAQYYDLICDLEKLRKEV